MTDGGLGDRFYPCSTQRDRLQDRNKLLLSSYYLSLYFVECFPFNSFLRTSTAYYVRIHEQSCRGQIKKIKTSIWLHSSSVQKEIKEVSLHSIFFLPPNMMVHIKYEPTRKLFLISGIFSVIRSTQDKRTEAAKGTNSLGSWLDKTC